MTDTVRDILEELDQDTLLSDGANDRSAEVLLMDEGAEWLDRPAGWDGGDICAVGADGFLKRPGILRLREPATKER